MSYTLDLLQGLCDYAVQQALVPTIHLLGTHSAGTATLFVDDVRPCVKSSIVSWHDGVTEAPMSVQSVTPSGQRSHPVAVPGQVVLDAPLTQGHVDGAVLTVNLLRTQPIETASMVDSGWPVVSFFVPARTDQWAEFNTWQPHVICCFVYQLSAQAPAGVVAQIFHDQQFERAETAVDGFLAALRHNPAITVNGTDYAFLVDEITRETIGPDTTGEAAPMWQIAADLKIRGLHDQF